MRHNAATKLEMEWPPVAKKRRVGKPSLDEQYSRALCDFVTTLEEPPETLPQTERPGWWRQGMSLFGGGAPPDAAEADATLELEKPKRTYHQPSRELRNWVVDYAQLRLLQGWDRQTIAQHLEAWLSACLPTFVVDADFSAMAAGQQEGGAPTARCLRCAHSHSAREVRPRWRGRRPDFSECDAAHLQQSGRAAWHDAQIRQAMDTTFPPLRWLQVSHRIRSHQDGEGSHAGGRAH